MSDSVTESMKARNAKARERIVIGDSNRNVTRAARKILEAEGHQVSVVDNGIELLVQVMACRPRAVIVDRHCRELDGLEICALLRSHSECSESRDAPLILLCEGLSPFDELKALALGVSATLDKPFGKSDLLNILQAVLTPAGPSETAPESAPGPGALEHAG